MTQAKNKTENRVTKIKSLIDLSNKMINAYMGYVADYHNPAPKFNGHRKCFDYSFLEGSIDKYLAIRNRLYQWKANILAV